MALDFNKKFRFRGFPVYNDARIFYQEILSLSRKFPRSELFCLTSQLLRASISIILNIAEGSARSTDKDFAHFLNNAHTSLNEVVACLDIAFDRKYILIRERDDFLEKANLLANQLTAFRKKLLNNPCK